MNLTFLDKPVTLIQLDEQDQLLQIWTETDKYVAQWSKKYQVHLIDTFNGGTDVEGRYWSSLPVSQINPKPGAIALEWNGLPTDVADWIEEAWEHSGYSLYCQVCDDHFLDELGDECQHLIWVDSEAEWRGCGYTGVWDLDQTYYRGLIRLFRWMGKPSLLALRNALEQDSFDLYPRTRMIARQFGNQPPAFGNEFGIEVDPDNHPNLASAIAWLESLEGGITQVANRQTITWIDQYLERYS
jgi:hypothetical protein